MASRLGEESFPTSFSCWWYQAVLGISWPVGTTPPVSASIFTWPSFPMCLGSSFPLPVGKTLDVTHQVKDCSNLHHALTVEAKTLFPNKATLADSRWTWVYFRGLLLNLVDSTINYSKMYVHICKKHLPYPNIPPSCLALILNLEPCLNTTDSKYLKFQC